MSTPHGPEEPIIVLIPVFNDWTATGMLLGMLDAELARRDLQVHVLLVDDASTEPPPADFLQTSSSRRPASGGLEARREGAISAVVESPPALRAITRVQILELRRNLGHQRAIAIGLSYIHANEPCQAVLIMDGDGEDDPREVPALIDAYRQHGGKKIIFARRTQRSESLVFRFFYKVYRFLYQAMTGQGINVGNFSILPFEAVDRLVAVTELWNHYASAVFKARLPCDSIPTRRANRLAGAPRMNFVSLVIHGLSAISAYGDVVGVRMLIASILVIVAAVVGISVVVGIRLLHSEIAIPGWATNAFGLLLVIIIQAIMSSVLFIFIILSNRQGANFLPVRDYSYFVLRTRRVACPK
jgi:polyisoprenyl-phosphate glycosyltransferase